MRPYLAQIAVGFIATLLVVFGNDLSGLVSKAIKPLNFIFRLIILIVVCAVGYTIMTNVLNHLTLNFLRSLPNRWLSLVVIVSFVTVGIVAERKKYM